MDVIQYKYDRYIKFHTIQSMDQLPDELIECIGMFLNVHDVCALLSVSKYICSHKRILWQLLSVRDHINLTDNFIDSNTITNAKKDSKHVPLNRVYRWMGAQFDRIRIMKVFCCDLNYMMPDQIEYMAWNLLTDSKNIQFNCLFLFRVFGVCSDMCVDTIVNLYIRSKTENNNVTRIMSRILALPKNKKLLMNVMQYYKRKMVLCRETHFGEYIGR
ncbi:MAG: hypothetical protein Dasosvirus2_16 [Dasosvirus sp.]|uniref:F-box domain-containing protein n=1 Tax=Dasosvirus sp. TaxID=2487764 RepID=A0A3G4ZR82_9VIRU|nr:MAG: hypothetical protein Dasosvirus2_16 [Dasosvirus sp.]